MPNEPNAFSDQIHIEQLKISTHIGVSEKERATPQRLTVSISLWPYDEARDVADKIENIGRSCRTTFAENFPRKEGHG